MKKMIENKEFSLTDITAKEMETIKNAFTLLVRHTDNELANNLLEVILGGPEVLASSKKSMRKKRSNTPGIHAQ